MTDERLGATPDFPEEYLQIANIFGVEITDPHVQSLFQKITSALTIIQRTNPNITRQTFLGYAQDMNQERLPDNKHIVIHPNNPTD